MMTRLEKLLKIQAPYHEIVAEMKKLQTEAIVRGELPEYWAAWKESRLDVASATIGSQGRLAFTYENTLRDIALWQKKFDTVDDIVKVTKADDMIQAKAQGKRGIILNFQNTTQIGMDLDNLNFFYDLGVRIMQLTYNTRNLAGNGCLERHDDGLSYFGLEVIRRMDNLGILIDVSHCGVRTTLEAIEASEAPVAITHSFCTALSNHARGKPDEVIQALGGKGGYFGVMLVPWFITSDPHPSLEHVFDHIDRVVRLIGVDKVGIGTDWGGTPPQPLRDPNSHAAKQWGGWRPEDRYDWRISLEGYQSWRDMPNITRGLVARGYTDDEIRGLLGQNFLRVFRLVVG